MWLLLTLLLTKATLAQVPLTLQVLRNWHVSPTDKDTKVAQVKLSQESRGVTNVTFGIEPSFHKDVSEYFLIDGRNGWVMYKGGMKSPGFLQVTATAVGAAVSKVEVKVDFATATPTTENFPLKPSIFTTLRTTSTATTPTLQQSTSTSTIEVTTAQNTTTTTTTLAAPSSTTSSASKSYYYLLLLLLLLLPPLTYLIYKRKGQHPLTKPHPRATSNAYIVGPPPDAKPNLLDSDDQTHDPLRIPRHHLLISHLIGEGCFGQVFSCDYNSTLVAVKTLKPSATSREKADLSSELSVLRTLGNHPNVVKFIGYVDDGDGPLLIVLEFVKYKLQDFLRDSRLSQSYCNLSKNSRLSSKDLTSYSLQIAKGMGYLSSHSIIHRDLAARNILLGEDNVCKVTDFGFARGLCPNGVYEKKSSDARLPIRWLPPEALYDSIYTTKSDVWSFGILMWEIVTLGSTPYPGMSPSQVMKGVKEGYRLEKPEHCSRELYNVMYYCWNEVGEDRPGWGEIVNTLETLIEEGEEYVKLDLFPEHCYYNMSVREDDEEKL